jgi:hypothetical protein
MNFVVTKLCCNLGLLQDHAGEVTALLFSSLLLENANYPKVQEYQN